MTSRENNATPNVLTKTNISEIMVKNHCVITAINAILAHAKLHQKRVAKAKATLVSTRRKLHTSN